MQRYSSHFKCGPETSYSCVLGFGLTRLAYKGRQRLCASKIFNIYFVLSIVLIIITYYYIVVLINPTRTNCCDLRKMNEINIMLQHN